MEANTYASRRSFEADNDRNSGRTRQRCSSLVNLNQTSQHRREKYNLARSCGKNVSWARSMRDWRLPGLEKRLGLEVTLHPEPYETPQD